jgi:hypothetical protein
VCVVAGGCFRNYFVFFTQVSADRFWSGGAIGDGLSLGLLPPSSAGRLLGGYVSHRVLHGEGPEHS